MTRMFFDIETIPSSDEHKDIHIEILRTKHTGEDPFDEEEVFVSTSLRGEFGRICCIGIIKENYRGEILAKEVIEGNETTILTRFWELGKDVTQFIGHNIYDFDFPFIYKRSRILGVKARLDISFARYRNTPIYDTMKEWDLWAYERRGSQSLDTLAKILRLPTSKDVISGKDVWPYFQDGKIKEISEYCMKDVVLTRQVYYKMTFQELPEMV